MGKGKKLIKNGDILTTEELRRFINYSLINTEKKEAVIGIVNEDISQKIKEISNETVSEVRIDGDHIRHSYNKSAHNLESDDLLHSMEVINKPTEIALETKLNHGSKVLIFKGNVNGEIYFIEGIHAKGGYISLITCYRQRKAGRGPTGINPRANVQDGAPIASVSSLSNILPEMSSGIFQ
jgi:hypothetical protein